MLYIGGDYITKFDYVNSRLEEVINDYGKLGTKEIEDKYHSSYSTIQRVLKANGIIEVKSTGKNVKYHYLNDNLESFKEDWINGVYSIEELATKYKCSKGAIKSKACEMNIKRKCIDEKINTNQLIADWNSRLYTNDELCEKYKICISTIKRILEKNNIKKDFYHSRLQKYVFDFNFFDNINTERKAYWLGLLYADGCNNTKRNTIRISLQECDEYLLKELYKDVKCDKEVSHSYNKIYNKRYSFIILQNKYFSKSLMDKGVEDNKTFKIKFPSEDIVPKRLIRHFIRGYFDGDGCVSIYNNNKSVIDIVGNYDFIKELNNYINNNIDNMYKDNITKSNTSNVYNLLRSGNYKVQRFMEYMYKDSSIFLHRKYDKYLKIKSNIYNNIWSDNMSKRIKELINKLNEASDGYYNSNPIMTDAEWDKIYKELQDIENETGIIYPNSPTQNVGYKIINKIEKEKLDHNMLSLDKCHSEKEIINFARNNKCVMSVKCDGMSITLKYLNGKLVSAMTRGTGTEGGVVTDNVKTIKNIPLEIPYKNEYIIDGEIIIDWNSFNKINEKLSKDKQFKNPRNLVSGTLYSLDTKIASEREMRFISWRVIKGSDLDSYYETLEEAKTYGFEVVPRLFYSNDLNEMHISYLLNKIIELADESFIPYDGAVITYDSISYGKSLGETAKFPRHSIAYKYEDKLHKTTLTDIEWSMGKSGQLTPVAIFEPVEIEGTTVERASVHNVSILTQLDLQVGDEITVYKSNQIIPQIRENLSAKNRESYIQIPAFCPICNSPTEVRRDNSTDVLVCTNPNCKGKLLGKVSHFVSKKGMDIDGLSEETIKKFIELGWINTIYDVYNLSEHFEKLKSFSGFGKKSVDKLKESIETSKTTTLKQFISALSIPNVGTAQAKILAKQFNTWDKFYEAAMSNYNFSKLEGFGEVMNNNIHKWFIEDNGNVEQIISLLTFEEENTNTTPSVDLTGKTFVITGSVHIFKNRDEFKAFVESANGKVSGSVSKNTYALVNNDKASNSSKNKKAKELNIPIVTEEEFMEMVKNDL